MAFWKNDDSRLKALEDRVHALTMALQDLTTCHNKLKDEALETSDRLARMRGLIYARKLHKPESEEPEAGKPSKAELLRRAGFTPGRPMVHTE